MELKSIKEYWNQYVNDNTNYDDKIEVNTVRNMFDFIEGLISDFTEYNFIEQYKFSDKCPKYKTKEQYEIFIKARNEDISNINKAIYQAREAIGEEPLRSSIAKFFK